MVGRGLEPPRDQRPVQQRLEAAVGVVEPVEVVRVLRASRMPRQPAFAVLGEDVFDDRTRLADHCVAIGDHRRRADGMQSLVFRRREARDRVALVALQLVVDAELLAEPDDALRLRPAEVMDRQHASVWRALPRQPALDSRLSRPRASTRCMPARRRRLAARRSFECLTNSRLVRRSIAESVRRPAATGYRYPALALFVAFFPQLAQYSAPRSSTRN